MKRSLTGRERLRRRADIGKLFRESRKVELKGIKLLYRENGLVYNRLAVTVRKGHRGAVARNREKRIVREIYRSFKSCMKSGFDLCFIVVSSGETFTIRRHQIEALLSSARLLSDREP